MSEGAPGLASDVLISTQGNLGRITLNRPKAINALTLGMVEAIAAALEGWRHDERIRAVILDGAGDRGFCAGGDVRQLYDHRPPQSDFAFRFWRREYLLDHAIATYAKPIVALMSGLVMGGGAGLGINASVRIVDASTRFAMPETGIGLVPDVGASWFLSRCPGETGVWLALTGEVIGAGEMLELGLADAAVKRDQHSALVTDIASALDSHGTAAAAIANALRAHGRPAASRMTPLRTMIARCFCADRIEDILAALETDASDWAIMTAASIRSKSPQMQKVALRALRLGQQSPDLASCLAREFRIVSHAAVGGEFYEGVRAAVIEKDRAPQWQPPTLADVSEAMVESYFAPVLDEFVIPAQP